MSTTHSGGFVISTVEDLKGASTLPRTFETVQLVADRIVVPAY
jgi:hypothetical protein